MTFDCFARGHKDQSPPDPGKYNIPSTFGQAPKYSIGKRYIEKEKERTPDFYKLPSTLSKKGFSIGPLIKPKRSQSVISTKKDSDDHVTFYSYLPPFGQDGRKISIHQRHIQPKDETPGPGSYNIDIRKSSPAFSCGVGKRFDFVKEITLVAPGSYDIPTTLDLSRPLTIGTHSRKKFTKKSHPGPIYNTRGKLGQDSPSYSFPKGPREPPTKVGPGPADYQKVEFGLTNDKKHQILPQMRSRTALPEKEVVTANVQFYDIQPSIVTKKKSIGSRPPTSYETLSPGPIYNIPSTIDTTKPAHIYNKTEIKNPNIDNPSPDSYWMAPVPPPSQPIRGFSGPIDDDRAVINIKQEKAKPGPADYHNEKPAFSPGKKGYKMSSRTIRQSRPDTAAPYYSTSTTLGGPMYTIGLKDV